jgi:hypothetical protein
LSAPQWWGMFLTESGYTQRSPGAVLGKVAPPAPYLLGLSMTPLLPVDPEVAVTMLGSPREVKETYLKMCDIVEGDRLVVGAVVYVVRAVAEWTDASAGGVSFLRVVAEEVK